MSTNRTDREGADECPAAGGVRRVLPAAVLSAALVVTSLGVPGPTGAHASPAAASLSPPSVEAFIGCGTGLLGDVTGDESVNIIDAQQIARWSVGLSVTATVESRISTHGDVTDDGNVNIIDAQQVARWSVGLSTTFAIGDPLPPCEGIRVTTSTTGSDPDPDGYQVLLDGAFASNIGINATVDLADATPGGHGVTLQGLAANCTITNGSATRNVTVVEGEAVSVDYVVECTGTGAGTLEVRNTTSCSSPPGSYTVTLDGGNAQSMPVDGTVTFNGVSFGEHSVTISGLGGCTAEGGATQQVTVSSGLNILHYSIVN